MAVKPWWLPEGVEPQQVIDLYLEIRNVRKVLKILDLNVDRKTLTGFLRQNNVDMSGRHSKCTECGAELINKATANQRYCKVCVPNAIAKMRLHKYGITQPQYDLMFESQMGLCDLCEQPLDNDIFIDHCHTQGHVRALLHSGCNTGLGYLENDKFVAQAFRYIERHKR